MLSEQFAGVRLSTRRNSIPAPEEFPFSERNKMWAGRLETVDLDESAVAVGRKHLGHDDRVKFHVLDGAAFLQEKAGERYDMIFADAWPGKFTHLETALSLLDPGGLYVIDDLLPQASWPEGHAAKIPPLIAALEIRADLWCTKLAWATGILIATKRA